MQLKSSIAPLPKNGQTKASQATILNREAPYQSRNVFYHSTESGSTKRKFKMRPTSSIVSAPTHVGTFLVCKYMTIVFNVAYLAQVRQYGTSSKHTSVNQMVKR